jgi:hypothetical protein
MIHHSSILIVPTLLQRVAGSRWEDSDDISGIVDGIGCVVPGKLRNYGAESDRA